MASHKKRPMAIVALVLSILAGLTLIISMCTPNWFESQQSRQYGFGKLGIWEACFSNYVDEKDSLGKRYNGCHALFSFELRSIYDRINPSWLTAIQVMMSIVLFTMISCVVLVILYFSRSCPIHQERKAVMVTFILLFLAGGLEGVSVIMFGIMADTDRQWLPHPDSNYLSWSFGIAVLSSFFALFGGMCLLVEWIRLNQENKNRTRRQNMALTSKPYSRY